ncbi:MAG: hypothetical protein LBK94_10035 [Prevotellaceae bacterium]|nr:hypothetical protein [Prevotellaceae bacterium]
MKKHLFIIISMFVFAANINAANKIAFAAEYSLFAEQNNAWYYVRSHRLTSGEMSRIGGAMVHLGHQKFFEHPATQRAITYLSLITPIGEGVGLIGNLIRTGAKFLTRQAVKEGYTFTKTAARHLTDPVKHGKNAGQLARPYMNSPLTVKEIMSVGKGVPDVWFKGGMNYRVPGTFRGSQGIWELGINPNTNVIYHFNFR